MFLLYVATFLCYFLFPFAVERVSNNTKHIQSKLQISEDVIDELKKNASQINVTITDAENSVNKTEQNINISRSNVNTTNNKGSELCCVCNEITCQL